MMIAPFDFRPRTRILFGSGEFARLGEAARELDGHRCLLVADQSMVDARHAQEAIRSLKARRMEVYAFHEFDANPTTTMVDAGYAFAAPHQIDLIVALGRGGALDCAKAINVLLTNGGSILDYRGYGNIAKPMLPMIAAPATAGGGSEALSYTLIADPHSREKILAGDSKLTFRVAVLDPQLTRSQPPEVTAASGFDAISHAVETMISMRRTPISDCFSREAWRLLDASFERVLKAPEDLDARGGMLVGAHFAGLAIEYSSLGPAHACAEPISAAYHLPHGAAMALVLRRVLDWLAEGSVEPDLPPGISERLRNLADLAGLPGSLTEAGIPEGALPRLAEEAAGRWSGRFSPRALDARAALDIYEAAL